MDHGSSCAERERNSPSFISHTFHRCSMCPPSVIRQTPMRQSIPFHTRVSISRSTRATAAVIRLRKSGDLRAVEGQRQCPSQTSRRKSRMVLNPGSGVATALTGHLLFLCVLSTYVASVDWDTLARLCSEPDSRLVERCNHYCLYTAVSSTSFLTCPMDLRITLYFCRHAEYRKKTIMLSLFSYPILSLNFFFILFCLVFNTSSSRRPGNQVEVYVACHFFRALKVFYPLKQLVMKNCKESQQKR